MMPGGGMMGWGLGGLGMAGGGLFMLLVWGLIVVGAVLTVRWLWDRGGQASGGQGQDSALVILRQRYARGEIDREEFAAKKRDLAG